MQVIEEKAVEGCFALDEDEENYSIPTSQIIKEPPKADEKIRKTRSCQ